MSEREPELDESLRSRFLALGEAVDAPLDAESERRIVVNLQQAARARDRRSRRLQAWLGGAGVLAAAAALGLVWLARQPAIHTVQEAQACAWGNATMTFALGVNGKRELTLGPAGRVVLAEGAEATARVGAGCALSVELTRGSLAAELGNLRPGSLRVHTSLGDVQVRGTTFSVDVDDGLHVVLLSGAVELVDDGHVALKMAPGKALRRGVRRAAPAVSNASNDEARMVSTLLSSDKRTEEPSAVDPAPTPPPIAKSDAPIRNAATARSLDLLAEAEAARRQGDTPRARALYAQAEQAANADAEVALLRHAGFELDTDNPAAAEKILAEHRRRFPRSRLAAEAAWIGVRALKTSGDQAATRAAARELLMAFPNTPQARAAQHLLEQP